MGKNPRLIDMTGKEFGLWTVIKKAGNLKGGAATWIAKCKCGIEREVVGQFLRNGQSRSCGCESSRARIGDLNKTHGQSKTRLYYIWKNMRARCSDPNNKDYGGRGITVCKDWQKFDPFMSWANASGYDKHLSIERIDVNAGYHPDNCTWADAATQAANRRFVRKREDGRLWRHVALENGITNSAYSTRIHDGWPEEEAATWPMFKKRHPQHRDKEGKYITPTESR